MTEVIRSKMTDCENKLLSQIASARVRREVVWHYLRATESDEVIDWDKVHNAIRDRWSNSAIFWIRNQARLRKIEEAGG